MEFTELEPVMEDRLRYPPFTRDDAFNYKTWVSFTGARFRWFVLREDRQDLVRVQIDDAALAGDHYDVPIPAGGYMQVAMIETAIGRRGQGLGALVVTELINLFPTRAFCAFSEADRFWTKVGWTANPHPTDAFYQTFFTRSPRIRS